MSRYARTVGATAAVALALFALGWAAADPGVAPFVVLSVSAAVLAVCWWQRRKAVSVP